MAVTVEEIAVGTDANLITATVTLATTPLAGDVVVVVYASTRGSAPRVAASVSGLGASWAASFAGTRQSYWIGTGASASGTVTVTQNFAGRAIVSAYLIRGLTGTTNSGAQTTAASATALVGPTIAAEKGMAVVTSLFFNNLSGTIVYPSAEAPAGGWTANAIATDGGNGRVGGTHRIPAGPSATHRNDFDTITSSVAEIALATLVIGDAVPSVDIEPPAATATADAPGPVIRADIRPPAAVASATSPTPTLGKGISPPAAVATATAAAPVVGVNISPPPATAVATAPTSPSVSLIPVLAYFEPPTRQEAVRDHFWGRYSIPVGQSVVKIDGTFVIHPYPWLGDIAHLEQGVEWFQGGRRYVISRAVAAELEADGFTVVYE